MKQIIRTEKAPAPIGPYNQAVRAGNLILTSGQIPLDLKTGHVCSADVEVQARKVLEYVETILVQAGSGLDRVVKVTVYLKDMGDFPKVNAVYANFFPAESAPARSCVEVARLPKDVLVEMEAIAVV